MRIEGEEYFQNTFRDVDVSTLPMHHFVGQEGQFESSRWWVEDDVDISDVGRVVPVATAAVSEEVAAVTTTPVAAPAIVPSAAVIASSACRSVSPAGKKLTHVRPARVKMRQLRPPARLL